MLRPICVTCERQMSVKKNGFLVNDPASGPFPATYWFGDLHVCEGCGAEVVVNFGAGVQARQCDPSQSMEFTR